MKGCLSHYHLHIPKHVDLCCRRMLPTSQRSKLVRTFFFIVLLSQVPALNSRDESGSWWKHKLQETLFPQVSFGYDIYDSNRNQTKWEISTRTAVALLWWTLTHCLKGGVGKHLKFWPRKDIWMQNLMSFCGSLKVKDAENKAGTGGLILQRKAKSQSDYLYNVLYYEWWLLSIWSRGIISD